MKAEIISDVEMRVRDTSLGGHRLVRVRRGANGSAEITMKSRGEDQYSTPDQTISLELADLDKITALARLMCE